MSEQLNAFLEKLDKKTRDRFKTAAQVEKELLPTSSLVVDYTTSGGFPRGAITTVYGNNSSGKTAMVLASIGIMQQMGYVCAFVDAEGTYDKAWGARLGVDNDSLILIRKKSFGAITDEVIPLLKAEIDFLAIDSISAALPEVFLDDDGELKAFEKQKQIGAHARSCTMMINALHYANERTAIVLISQTTTDLSGMHPVQVPHGGRKVGFASSIMLRLTSSPQENQQIKGQVFIGDKIHELPIGREVKVEVTKNKIGPHARTGRYNFYYAGDHVGIDNVDELVTLGKLFGVVRASGAWVYFGDGQWNGQTKFVTALKEDPELFAQVRKELDTVMTGEIHE